MRSLLPLLLVFLFACSEKDNGQTQDSQSQSGRTEKKAPLTAHIKFCAGAPGEARQESSLFDYLEGAYAHVTFNRAVSADEYTCRLSTLNNIDYSVKNTMAVALELNESGTEGIYVLNPEATALVLCLENANGNVIACDTASFFIEGDAL